MARKGHDLRLTRYDRKEWGTEHSPTSARATICYPQSGRPRGCKKHSCVRDENRSSWKAIDWRHHGRIANPLSKMSRPRGGGRKSNAPSPRLRGLARAMRLGDGNTAPNPGLLISFTRRDHEDSIPLGRAEE